MSIGKMNQKITLKSYTYGKTAGGGPTKTTEHEYEQWAEASDRSGRPFTSEGQGLYSYDMRFKFRSYPSRAITSQFIIEYEGKDYKIENLTKEREGKVFYWIARCSKVDNV